jgi:hypothetical protein
MRQTESLPTPRFSLVRWVFAGCRQSLLGIGPSRHYLHNPCTGAWTPAPWRPFGAHTRFFPKDFGLTLENRSSARQMIAAMQLPRRNLFRSCSHSFMFRLPYSLDPLVAPTTELRSGQPSRLHHASPGWLPIPRCGITTCLKSGNWHDGTFTRWIAALSAAPFSQVPVQTVRLPATDLDPGTPVMHSPLHAYQYWLPGNETLGPVQQ